MALVGPAWHVESQEAISLDASEPEPDIALYTRKSPGKARAQDVHLVIEVADSSLEFDRTVKLPLYAEAGIRELWIVNLVDEQLEVYRQPLLDGSFASADILNRGAMIQPLDFPGISLRVEEVLP